jgi:DNA-binding protein Fis
MITFLIAEDEHKIKDTLSKMLKEGGYSVFTGQQGALYKAVMEKIEKPLLEYVLEQTEGNQLKSARILGINRNTLRTRVKKLGIDIDKWKTAR